MNVKLSPEQEKFIKNFGKIIHLDDVVPEYETIYSFPWYFRPIKGTDEWEMVLPGELPKQIKLKLMNI